MKTERLAEQLRGCAAEKLADYFAQVRRCAELLSPEQLWYRANEASNSVGNLLLHLHGNITQWILGGIGGRRFERDRAGEFSRRVPVEREALLTPLSETVDEACRIVREMDAGTLGREYTIQEYRVSGLAAVLHVVEHFAFHTGQIVTTTKWLLGVDLSLYDEQGHRRDERRSGAP